MDKAKVGRYATLAPGQIKLLRGLRDAGGSGVFDRWVRVVAGGEVLTSAGSTTALTAFRYGWIRMVAGRVEITPAGRAVLDRMEKGDGQR